MITANVNIKVMIIKIIKWLTKIITLLLKCVAIIEIMKTLIIAIMIIVVMIIINYGNL